jgi:uncharacterized protein
VSVALVVIAKAPAPGRSKTRLTPPCTPEQAAVLAEAALRDTLDAATAAESAGRRVIALDGTPRDWLPDGWDVIPQRGRRLDERLAHAFEDVGGPALVIGMDTPQVSAALLDDSVLRLSDGVDAVLGPAADGGFWALGLREPHARLVLGVPMSAPHTGRAQHARLRAHGLRVATLAVPRDVDRFSDARVVAAAAPQGRFARALARIA